MKKILLLLVILILAFFFLSKKSVKPAGADVSGTGPGYIAGFQGYPTSGISGV
jgi:hypothetical protein